MNQINKELSTALFLDDNGNKEGAYEKYLVCIKLILNEISTLSKAEQLKNSGKLFLLANECFKRVEDIFKKCKKEPESNSQGEDRTQSQENVEFSGRIINEDIKPKKKKIIVKKTRIAKRLKPKKGREFYPKFIPEPPLEHLKVEANQKLENALANRENFENSTKGRTLPPNHLTTLRRLIDNIDLAKLKIQTIEKEIKGCQSLKIHQLNPSEVAVQLTVLGYKIKNIQFYELESISQDGYKNVEELSPQGFAQIQFARYISYWVANEILSYNNSQERANAITHFIRIASDCLQACNYEISIAIITGLHRPSILRLKNSWSLVFKKASTSLTELLQIISPKNDYEILRQKYKQSPVKPIPYLGLFLSDLEHLYQSFSTGFGFSEPGVKFREDIKKLFKETQNGKPAELKENPMIQHYLLSRNPYVFKRVNNGDEKFWSDSSKLEISRVHQDYPSNMKDHHQIYKRVLEWDKKLSGQGHNSDSGDEENKDNDLYEEFVEEYEEEEYVDIEDNLDLTSTNPHSNQNSNSNSLSNSKVNSRLNSFENLFPDTPNNGSGTNVDQASDDKKGESKIDDNLRFNENEPIDFTSLKDMLKKMDEEEEIKGDANNDQDEDIVLDLPSVPKDDPHFSDDDSDGDGLSFNFHKSHNVNRNEDNENENEDFDNLEGKNNQKPDNYRTVTQNSNLNMHEINLRLARGDLSKKKKQEAHRTFDEDEYEHENENDFQDIESHQKHPSKPNFNSNQNNNSFPSNYNSSSFDNSTSINQNYHQESFSQSQSQSQPQSQYFPQNQPPTNTSSFSSNFQTPSNFQQPNSQNSQGFQNSQNFQNTSNSYEYNPPPRSPQIPPTSSFQTNSSNDQNQNYQFQNSNYSPSFPQYTSQSPNLNPSFQSFDPQYQSNNPNINRNESTSPFNNGRPINHLNYPQDNMNPNGSQQSNNFQSSSSQLSPNMSYNPSNNNSRSPTPSTSSIQFSQGPEINQTYSQNPQTQWTQSSQLPQNSYQNPQTFYNPQNQPEYNSYERPNFNNQPNQPNQQISRPYQPSFQNNSIPNPYSQTQNEELDLSDIVSRFNKLTSSYF